MLKKVLAATLAAGLTVAPIAAQAGERASATEVSLASIADLDRAPAPISEENEELRGKITPAIAAAIAIFVGVTLHEIFTSKGIFD